VGARNPRCALGLGNLRYVRRTLQSLFQTFASGDGRDVDWAQRSSPGLRCSKRLSGCAPLLGFLLRLGELRKILGSRTVE